MQPFYASCDTVELAAIGRPVGSDEWRAAEKAVARLLEKLYGKGRVVEVQFAGEDGDGCQLLVTMAGVSLGNELCPQISAAIRSALPSLSSVRIEDLDGEWGDPCDLL